MDTPNDLSREEEALYNMSDEELEAAFREAKNSLYDEPEDDIGSDVVEDEEEYLVDDEEINEDIVEAIDEEEVDELDEVDESEDLEQPDDEDSTEPENEEEDVEEDTLSEKDDAEKADESKEDQPKENIDLENQKFKVKADGSEFEFNIKELMQLAPKAMNYTRKMQELKPWRKTISALQDNEISQDDINLMIDVLKGDKDAITSVIQRTGFDPLEIDPEKEVSYNPNDYGRSEQELDIQEIENRISRDPEYNITTHVVNSQWDDRSRAAMFENPGMIEGLHSDIRSGVFDKVSPMAMKMKALDGGRKSDIEYYVEAGADYYRQLDAERTHNEAQERANQEAQKVADEQRQAVEQVKTRSNQQATIKKTAAARKAASPTKRAAGTRNVVDYLEDNDEAFDDWYNKLQASI